MLSTEQLKEISDIEKTLRNFNNLSMFSALASAFSKKTSVEVLEDLKELKKFLDESLDVTNKLSDSRVSTLVMNHRKHVGEINPLIEEIIANRSRGNLNWGSARLANEVPSHIYLDIAENLKLILSILRLPKESDPFVFSLNVLSGEKSREEQDLKSNLLASELISHENTSVLSEYKGGIAIGGATGPLFDFVTIVTLISVAANITKLSETLWKFLKKGEKNSGKIQITVKTSTGEVALNNLPADEIEKILESLRGMMKTEKSDS
jgi:hypothetical protein